LPTAASRRLEPRRPSPARRHPLTPAWLLRRRGASPSLLQFVVLSLLLHALFIVLFGSPSGGSPQGRALWGSLDVTIRGPLLDSGPGSNTARETRLRLPGSELLERRQETKAAAPVAVTPPDTVTPPAPAIAPAPVRAAPDASAAPVGEVVPVPPAMLETPVLPATTDLVPAPRVAPIPREVPVVSAPTLDFAPRPVLENRLAPPAELLPVAKPPSPVPVIPAQTLPAMTLPAAGPSLDTAVNVAPPAAQPVAPKATERTAVPASERAGAREPARSGTPAPRDSPIFDNRRPPAAEAPPSGDAPRIDLDAARARARDVAREGSGNRALLPFAMPPAPERKTKEQLAIEKAWKPDCKDAYKGLGLLAAVPLIANEFGEGTCRW